MVFSHLRNISATLLSLSGISHIAELWIADITLATLVSVSFGAVYLFIAIGLYGQSRFALTVAIIIPATGVSLALATYSISSFTSLGLSQVAVDSVVIVFSAVILFAVRNKPSA